MVGKIEVLDTRNFKSFISSGISVVDFYADWCVAPNTQIYHSPIHSRPAWDIKKDENIISWRDGLVKDSIHYSKKSNKAGHCKQIISSSGRVIETTDDHGFFTSDGWKAANTLKVGDKIAILPVIDHLFFEGEDKILLQKSDFDFLSADYKNIEKYMQELDKLSLLTLKKNDPKILILARLIGALFSDGCLYSSKKNNYREISFTLGQKRDVEDIIHDLSSLGFNTVHVSERNSDCEINGRKFSMHTFRVKCLSTALYLLFKLLGVPEGNKTNKVYDLPLWIKNSELSIKKEFLSAYLGGDGPKLDIRMVYGERENPYNCININDIEFHKRIDILENGLLFAESLRALLGDFGIDGKVFHEIDPYVRKDKTQSAILHIRIKHNISTAFIIAQRIGYSYCWQKQQSAMYVGEFARKILFMRSRWKNVYDSVMRMAEKEKDIRKISEISGVSENSIYNWVKKGVKPTVQKHFIKFDEWLMNSTKELKDGFVWDNVESIKTIYLPEVQILTTENDHNFVANGFLVHNCGPCKIMAPAFERAANKSSAKFAKLNVDGNQDIAMMYGVLSIPTTIVFKNGVVKDMHTGTLNEAEIIKLAEKYK